MRLAARMAMHAAAWQATAPTAWHPGTRAVAWEHGAMDGAPEPPAALMVPGAEEAAGRSSVGGALRAAPIQATEPMRSMLEEQGAQVQARPALAAIDATQVRGSAWSHGVYRLFVRGRAVARPGSVAREPEIMPCFEPARSMAVPEPVRVARPVTVEPRPGTLQVELRAEARPPVEPQQPLEVEQRAGARPAVPGTLRVELRPAESGFGSLHVEPSLTVAADGVVRRVVEWSLGDGERPAVLGGALARLELPTAAAWRTLVPQLAGVPMPGEDGSPAVFLDVETTALDRGAGALAFMVGLAAFVGGVLRVEQWILAKLSAEPAMLAEVVERVAVLAGPGAVLASYNGASFDVPLLRARLQRARQFAQLGPVRSGLERPHVDLLHPARRMWQGRDRDCRLATLERTRLGVRRVHDLAGHEIPAVFWAWLRRPDDGEVQALMQRAADHNLADLVTLPALGAAIGRCLTAPDDLEAAVRSAQHLITCGRRDQALALLADWRTRPGPAPLRRRALLLAADLLRRDGATSAATGAPALWREVCRISPGDPVAHEALAKHLEHRVGDVEQALTVAQGSAAPCPRRVARLQRKLGVPPAN